MVRRWTVNPLIGDSIPPTLIVLGPTTYLLQIYFLFFIWAEGGEVMEFVNSFIFCVFTTGLVFFVISDFNITVVFDAIDEFDKQIIARVANVVIWILNYLNKKSMRPKIIIKPLSPIARCFAIKIIHFVPFTFFLIIAQWAFESISANFIYIFMNCCDFYFLYIFLYAKIRSRGTGDTPIGWALKHTYLNAFFFISINMIKFNCFMTLEAELYYKTYFIVEFLLFTIQLGLQRVKLPKPKTRLEKYKNTCKRLIFVAIVLIFYACVFLLLFAGLDEFGVVYPPLWGILFFTYVSLYFIIKFFK